MAGILLDLPVALALKYILQKFHCCKTCTADADAAATVLMSCNDWKKTKCHAVRLLPYTHHSQQTHRSARVANENFKYFFQLTRHDGCEDGEAHQPVSWMAFMTSCTLRFLPSAKRHEIAWP